MRRNRFLIRNITVVVLFLAVVGGLMAIFANNPLDTEAVSLDGFKAGNIISDAEMSNYNSMSLDQIQQFLSDHGNCRDYGIDRIQYNPGAKYSTKDGHFVCMAEERFGDGVKYGDDLKPGEGQTAAEIIYEVSQEYKINPKVLIVLLEKEQGLISDSWPHSGQYKTATGFGCPDTAACDSQYFGLKNQLENAAYLFRTVLNGGWTNYPVGYNYIGYNPSASCGGSMVYIENLATSALYRYTPYQPNQGALDAGYGTAYCGSYGNRNFYLFYKGWFGSTQGSNPNYAYYDINDIKSVELDEGEYEILYEGNKYLKLGSNNNAEVSNGKSSLSLIKEDGYYLIKENSKNLYLSLDGDVTNKTNVKFSQKNESCSQRWMIGDVSGNNVIYSNCDVLYVLDIADGISNAQIYRKTSYDNTHQYWGFAKKIINLEQNKPTANTTPVAVPSNDQLISNGNYEIKTADSSRNLIIKNSNAIVSGLRDSSSRSFSIEYSSSKKAYLIKSNDGYLSLSSNAIVNKLNVIGNSQANDLCYWIIEKSGNSYILRSYLNSEFVLDIADGLSNAQVYKKTSYENDHQLFNIAPIDSESINSGSYKIHYFGDYSKLLSVESEKPSNAFVGNIINNTSWSIIDKGGYYVIKNDSTGLLLDVTNGVFANKTNVWQYSENLSCAQRWDFEYNTDGSIVIVNSCHREFVLDIADGISNAQIYRKTDYDNSHQKWIITE